MASGTGFTLGSGTFIQPVLNYAALPAANTVPGAYYFAREPQGTWWLPFSLGGTFHNSGLYYSNGTKWVNVDTPYQATQLEVDTGTNNDKFVTPLTLTSWNGGGIYQLLAQKNDQNGYPGMDNSYRIQVTRDAGGGNTAFGHLTHNSPINGNVWTLPDATGTIALTSDLETLPYVAKTANYTITASDYTIDCTANTFTVTLPTAVGITGRIYNVKNSGLGTTITLNTTNSQTIDGSLTQSVNSIECLTVQSNGANWIVI